MTKPVLRDFASVCGHGGGFGPDEVEISFGDLTIDVIGHSTAEELLTAFSGHLDDVTAKMVVSALLDGGLTYDAIVDGSVS